MPLNLIFIDVTNIIQYKFEYCIFSFELQKSSKWV